MKYYIGVDGGGTKTAICAADPMLETFLYAETSGSAWRELGIENVVENIKQAIQRLIPQGGEIAAMALGIPCFGESEQGDRMVEQEISKVFSDIPVYITNDVEVGWAGSLLLEPGINVVAGTGSIAYGEDDKGGTARSGGWDEFYSDEGSGYWMGRKMMELFTKQSDGRVPRGALYDMVREELSIQKDMEFVDIMRGEYLGRRERVAHLQLIVERAARKGDQSAKELYTHAAEELCLLAAGVKKQLNFPEKNWKVSYSGGVFKAGDLILEPFAAGIKALGGTLTQPACSPVDGALLLAFHKFHPDNLPLARKILLSRN